MTEHVKCGTQPQERNSMYLKAIKMLSMQLLSTILMGMFTVVILFINCNIIILCLS